MGNKPASAQNMIPITRIVRHVGISQRIRVHSAYKFQARMAMGWAVRRISLASIFGPEPASVFPGIFPGMAFLRMAVGMVKLTPQYLHAM